MPLSTWVERTKQNLHLGDKTFKPTPNVRNPKMLEEADEFARHMTTYRNHLIKYERVMSSFLATLPQVCRANLPRVWEAVEGTSMCEPTSPEISSAHPTRAGGEYDELLMVDAAEILRRRMENIVRPIDRWLESLNVVKVRMARLDALRMQVDSRRRRVHRRFLRAIRNLSAGEAAALQAQTSELTTGRGGASALGPEGEVLPGEPASGLVGPGATSARMPGTSEAYTYGIDTDSDEEADWEHMRNREDYAREAISQHRKLEAVAESYREQEQLVFEQLSGLVRDAAYFKSYVASSFLVVKDTLVATLVSLGACKRPLPGFSERESAEGGALYGRIADIQDLVVQLPPVVKAGGRQLPFGRNSALVPPQQIRPTRITAQPLQVAADDVSAPESRYSPVPAVVKPASQIARDQLHDGSGLAAEPEGPYTAEPYPEAGAYETTGTYQSAAGQRSFGSQAMPAGVTPYPTYAASPAGGHPVGTHITGATPYPTYVASTGDAGAYKESMGAQPQQGAYAAMQGELAR